MRLELSSIFKEMGTFIFLLLSLALCVDAKLVSQWAVTGEAIEDHVVGFNVALKKQNLDEFDRRFVAMTTPGRTGEAA